MKSLTRTSTTSLPSIGGTNSSKIHEFYEKLVNSVQSLETLGKLKEVNGYARNTLDKLEGIRGDLVRTDDEWHNCMEFPQLIEALRKWMERNSAIVDEKKHEKDPPEKSKQGKSYQTKQEWKSRCCVYCESANHKSSKCDKVTDITERKKYLSVKQLCFNCTWPETQSRRLPTQVWVPKLP